MKKLRRRCWRNVLCRTWKSGVLALCRKSAQSAQSSNAQNSQERSVHAQEQPAHVPGVEVKICTYLSDKNHVVNNVSFRVMPGDFVGLLGPNGAGKRRFSAQLWGCRSHALARFCSIPSMTSTIARAMWVCAATSAMLRGIFRFPCSTWC